MDLYNAIWKRKSVRKYDMTPLEDEQLSRIMQFAESMKPLYPGIKTAYEIIAGVKNFMAAKAPHYFAILSEETDGYLENAGFMFQQMDLYLTSIGLGSCWLGMAKPAEKLNAELPLVITLAFGKADESPYRELSDFKRKPLSDISSGDDARLEAARVAPSAVNNQNWFFAAESGKIDVFQKKAAIGIFEKMNRIDIGIALCHLFVATEESGREFIFAKDAEKEKKGYIYTGTVE